MQKHIKEIKQLIKKELFTVNILCYSSKKNLYSKSYFKEIENIFLIEENNMISLFDKLKKKFSNMEESYNGVNIEDIIKYGLMGRRR